MPIQYKREFMQLAIDQAQKNITSLHGGPFGACIVKNRTVIAVARNTVLKSDATSHAEINAIRLASKKLKTFDLSGCVIYSTTEPCPMCFSAIHWARIKTIVFGTVIGDVKKIGFNEMPISNIRLRNLGKSTVEIIPHFMRDECLQLLAEWQRLKTKVVY